MNKSKKRLIIINIFFVLFITGIVFLVWNSYQVEVTKRPSSLVNFSFLISNDCGIENCHGLDIVCGSNVAQMCDMMYMLGDRCRQYAHCEKKDGKCQPVWSPQFESCKLCVQECESKFINNSGELFICESECG